MGISLYKVARMGYGKILSTNAYGKFLASKNNRKIQRVKSEIEKKLDAICATYAGCDASDASYTILAPQDAPSDQKTFSIDVLGALSDNISIDWELLSQKMADVLHDEECLLRVALDIREDATSNDSPAASFGSLKLIALSKGHGVIAKIGDSRIAVFAFDASSGNGEGDSVLNDDVLKQIAVARNEGCNYSIALFNANGLASEFENGSNDGEHHTKKVFQALAEYGVNAAFAVTDGDLNLKGAFDRIDGRAFIEIGNIGELAGQNEFQDGASAVLRLDLEDVQGSDAVKMGYIPLWFESEQDSVANVVRIDYLDKKHRDDLVLMDHLVYIEGATGDLNDIRCAMSLQDICDVIGVELPSKYEELGNQSVRKISAWASKVKPGDVYFFLPPFEDKNDKRPSSLLYQLPSAQKAFNNGAMFIFSYAPLGEEIPHMVLSDVREANITLSRHIREQHDLEVVGITGSIGKTSTKDMLQKVLNEKFRTRGNVRNSNAHISIGHHVQDFSGADEFFIQEIGGGRPGGASRHSRMIKPSACVITNIGDAHIGNFGSREKIMENKLKITDGMDENGVLFLNGDDPLLINAEPDVETVYFAVDNKDADYYAEDIREENGDTFFTIVHGSDRVDARLKVLGHYNVLNAVCSFAIGKHFGLSDDEIVDGLLKFETSGTRQNLVSVAGYDLFVDCFNASPASVASTLSVLDVFDAKGKKIAVIGDITGMGEMSKDIHEQVAEIVVQHNMDLLVCYGEESKLVHERAKAAGINSVNITKPGELEDFLKENISPGDFVLFKGSSKMKLAERVDSLFGTLLAEQSFIDHGDTRKSKSGPIEYTRNPSFAVVSKAANVSTVKIKGKFYGVAVVAIGNEAFAYCNNLTSVTLPASIRHIGDKSFYCATSLTSISLPDSMRYIGKDAFCDCTALEEVQVNDGLMHISDRAFCGCKNLKRINLPGSVSYIGEDSFKDCDNVTVTCEENTYAYEYCRGNDINVETC